FQIDPRAHVAGGEAKRPTNHMWNRPVWPAAQCDTRPLRSHTQAMVRLRRELFERVPEGYAIQTEIDACRRGLVYLDANIRFPPEFRGELGHRSRRAVDGHASSWEIGGDQDRKEEQEDLVHSILRRKERRKKLGLPSADGSRYIPLPRNRRLRQEA